MSRTVKCGSCGVKHDFAQMNKCPNCKKYYCDNCVTWSLSDEHLGDSAKYYLTCSNVMHILAQTGKHLETLSDRFHSNR